MLAIRRAQKERVAADSGNAVSTFPPSAVASKNPGTPSDAGQQIGIGSERIAMLANLFPTLPADNPSAKERTPPDAGKVGETSPPEVPRADESTSRRPASLETAAPPAARTAALIIRDKQEAVLANVSRTKFVARMETHLRQHFASIVKPFTSERLCEFVARNWNRANEYGLKSELAVCCYLEAATELGEEALSEGPIGINLQEQELSETEKCELLNNCILQAWEKKGA